MEHFGQQSTYSRAVLLRLDGQDVASKLRHISTALHMQVEIIIKNQSAQPAGLVTLGELAGGGRATGRVDVEKLR
eukprot:2242330-Amphidinium_carterae.1